MQTYVITLTSVTNLPFTDLIEFRNRLDHNNFGAAEWYLEHAMRWTINADDLAWEDELLAMATDCNIPTWFLSISNGGAP